MSCSIPTDRRSFSLRQSIAKNWMDWKKAAQRHCNRSKTGSMPKSLRRTMTPFSAMALHFIKSAAWSKQNNLVLYFASSTEQSEYSLCSAFLFTAPIPKRSRTLPSAGSPLETAGWRKTAASKTLGSRETAVPALLPASRPCRSTAPGIPPQNT